MMPTAGPDARILRAMLQDARARTLALSRDLGAEQLLGPKLKIVNPPLWEIGHLGWFQEHWCLRYRENGGLKASMLAHADDLYNSATVPHATRWDLPLPDIDATLAYLKGDLRVRVTFPENYTWSAIGDGPRFRPTGDRPDLSMQRLNRLRV